MMINKGEKGMKNINQEILDIADKHWDDLCSLPTKTALILVIIEAYQAGFENAIKIMKGLRRYELEDNECL